MSKLHSMFRRRNKFGKIFQWCACGRQYFRNTVRRRPPWLSLFGPAFAAVECCWVQTTAFCQSRTRHMMFHCKFFYCAPYIFVCHSILLLCYVSQSNILILVVNLNKFNLYLFLWNGAKINRPKNFLTIYLTNVFLCIIFRFVKGAKPNDRTPSVRRAQSFQTPSYILSPLDFGPETEFQDAHFFFSFPSFQGIRKHTATGGVFLL